VPKVKRYPGQTKPKIGGARELNKPTAPENTKAGKTMRRLHDQGGVHKPVSKKQPEGSRKVRIPAAKRF